MRNPCNYTNLRYEGLNVDRRSSLCSYAMEGLRSLDGHLIDTNVRELSF